jgi:hypothetical protein
MGGEERRDSERIQVKLAVHFARGATTYRLVSDNLSLGGIFLRGADDACACDDVVELSIVVPSSQGGEERHLVRAVVAQVMPGQGAGLRFVWTEQTAAARFALVRFIQRAGMMNAPLLHTETIGLVTDAEKVTGE